MIATTPRTIAVIVVLRFVASSRTTLSHAARLRPTVKLPNRRPSSDTLVISASIPRTSAPIPSPFRGVVRAGIRICPVMFRMLATTAVDVLCTFPLRAGDDSVRSDSGNGVGQQRLLPVDVDRCGWLIRNHHPIRGDDHEMVADGSVDDVGGGLYAAASKQTPRPRARSQISFTVRPTLNMQTRRMISRPGIPSTPASSSRNRVRFRPGNAPAVARLRHPPLLKPQADVLWKIASAIAGRASGGLSANIDEGGADAGPAPTPAWSTRVVTPDTAVDQPRLREPTFPVSLGTRIVVSLRSAGLRSVSYLQDWRQLGSKNFPGPTNGGSESDLSNI